MTSATTTSRRSCRPTTGVWSCSMTACCSSPIPRTPPSTSTSTSNRSRRRAHVRKGWREVLRPRHPHPLLGREPRELGEGRRAVREGLDRVLPRLPEPGTARDPLADREVPEVLRGGLRQGHVRRGPRRRGDLPADV